MSEYLKKYYDEGVRAARQSRPNALLHATEVPYPRNTAEGDAWLRGYQSVAHAIWV